jgi:hypothetical protein
MILISGHTCLLPDRDFASTEKRQRKYAHQVFSPQEWKQIILGARTLKV